MSLDALFSQLQQEQFALERQLHMGQDACAAPPLNCRQIHEISVSTLGATAEEMGPHSGTQQPPPSVQDRLQELHKMKNKYAHDASHAMRQYLRAVSDYPGYQSRREHRLRTAKPFSFECRELMKPTRIHERRVEYERQRREAELHRALHTPFRATPVPPTTFMNKYDLLVEEWCERRVAAGVRAQQRADRARDEAAFVNLSALALQSVRAELMGAHYTADGRAIPRCELRQRRARSAGGKPAPLITQPEDIPLEVRMRLWPAIKEHEQVRKERILQRAAGLKKEADEYARSVIPQLSSPNPPRLFADAALASTGFGIGQPINATPALSGPAPLSETQALPPPAAATAPIPPPSTAAPVSLLPSAAQHQSTTTTTTAAPVPDKPPSAAAPPASHVARNPNLTFRPRVAPGVPDFGALWVRDAAQMAERKKSRPPTVPQAFSLTPTTKDLIVRGKPPSRAVSQPPVKRGGGGTAEGRHATRNVIPKGTRAHALRTEAVYSMYIHKVKEVDTLTTADQAYLKEAAKRRRQVVKHLLQYIGNPHLEHESVIRAKVKELRARMRENERTARERLQEMKARVAQMPPLFAEPTPMNDLTKAREEAERDILKVLKQSGLDARTIRDILTKSADGDDDTVAAAAAAAIAGHPPEPAKVDATPVAETPVDASATAMQKPNAPPRPATESGVSAGESSSSSFTSSRTSSSSSGGSNSSRSASPAPKGANKIHSDYSSDDFESSTSS